MHVCVYVCMYVSMDLYMNVRFVTYVYLSVYQEYCIYIFPPCIDSFVNMLVCNNNIGLEHSMTTAT